MVLGGVRGGGGCSLVEVTEVALGGTGECGSIQSSRGEVIRTYLNSQRYLQTVMP